MTSEQQNLGKSNNESEVGVNDTLLPKKVPENWEVCKIQDILERVSSRVEPSEMDSQNYISLKHMGKGEPRIKDYGDASEVSSQKYEFSSGDILFGKLRPYFRKVALARSDGICSTDINVVKPIESVDRDFLFYTLFRQDFIDIADKTSTGTRMPRADWQKLDDLKIALPPAKEQKKISRLLYQIDSKIEANNRINELLEEIAQALFKSWFVDFEQFNHFKKSEVGKIPTDFKIKKITEFAEIILGNSPNSDYYNEERNGLPFFQGSKNFGLRYPEIERWCTKEKKVAEEDDVLISIRAPVGDVNRTSERCVVGRGVTALRMEQHDNQFLYHLLKAKKQEWEKYKSGTTFNSINKTDIQEFPVAMPPDEEISRFNRRTEPMAEIFKNNIEENNRLADLRDTLLPKLMSGEIRVNDIELDELEVDSEV